MLLTAFALLILATAASQATAEEPLTIINVTRGGLLSSYFEQANSRHAYRELDPGCSAGYSIVVGQENPNPGPARVYPANETNYPEMREGMRIMKISRVIDGREVTYEPINSEQQYEDAVGPRVAGAQWTLHLAPPPRSIPVTVSLPPSDEESVADVPGPDGLTDQARLQTRQGHVLGAIVGQAAESVINEVIDERRAREDLRRNGIGNRLRRRKRALSKAADETEYSIAERRAARSRGEEVAAKRRRTAEERLARREERQTQAAQNRSPGFRMTSVHAQVRVGGADHTQQPVTSNNTVVRVSLMCLRDVCAV